MKIFLYFEGVTIGFEEEQYSAGESDGMAFVVATVLMGELATRVIVEFRTEPQTASSKEEFVNKQRESNRKFITFLSSE